MIVLSNKNLQTSMLIIFLVERYRDLANGMNLNSGILSVKQLIGHFNWINGTGLLVFILLSSYFILYLRMGPLALILSFTIKNIFQIICMGIVLRSNSPVLLSLC